MCELPCNLFLQHAKGIGATLEHLVHSLHSLDELAREYVRVSRVLNIVRDLGWNYYVDRGRCSRQLHEVLNERLAASTSVLRKSATRDASNSHLTLHRLLSFVAMMVI